MKKMKKYAVSAAILSVVLSGCASNDELIKQQGEQISSLTSKMNALSDEVSQQAKKDAELSTSVRQLQQTQNNLAAHIEKSASQYAIQEKDTLNSVAAKHNMSLEELLKQNPQIKNPNRILIGQIINL